MSRSLGSVLRSLVHELDSGVQTVYDELGVEFRPRFYPIAEALLKDGCLTVGEIADRIGVSQPAATQTLNEMKRIGLIEASAGPDRRARPIRLTAKAGALLTDLEPVWRAIHRAADALDAELPESIGAVAEKAMAALCRQGFAERVRTQLKAER